MLVQISPLRFEARCVGCLRVSPATSGTQEEVETELTRLGWGFDAKGEAHCSVCMQRKTTRRAKFEG